MRLADQLPRWPRGPAWRWSCGLCCCVRARGPHAPVGPLASRARDSPGARRLSRPRLAGGVAAHVADAARSKRRGAERAAREGRAQRPACWTVRCAAARARCAVHNARTLCARRAGHRAHTAAFAGPDAHGLRELSPGRPRRNQGMRDAAERARVGWHGRCHAPCRDTVRLAAARDTRRALRWGRRVPGGARGHQHACIPGADGSWSATEGARPREIGIEARGAR